MPSSGAHSLALTSLSFRSDPCHCVSVAATISWSTIIGAQFCGISLQKYINNPLLTTYNQQTIYHQCSFINPLSAINISSITQSATHYHQPQSAAHYQQTIYHQ